ncbi:MAG TPA: metallophosphoesterase [Bacteroidales bacterium]|nr:metallophosphoesterase [Bacteroidales bacterium]
MRTPHRIINITLLSGVILLFSCSEEFKFVQVSDPQFGMISGNKGVSEETLLYIKAVEGINSVDPALVIVTGDLVNDRSDSSQLNEFKRITLRIKTKKIYVTPGNHDVGNDPAKKDIEEFSEKFGSDRFSFSYKKCWFIGFNSNLIKSTDSNLEEEQYRWLQDELEKAKDAMYIFLFCHHPFFVNDPEEPEEYFNINPAQRKKYLDLFAEYGVDAVFAGHLHKNVSARAGNMKMITTSSAGKQLGNDLPGFRLVTVSRQGFTDTYIKSDD